jgi:holo-[acyl-carrier protein] synthase
MVLGLGNDIIEIQRIEDSIKRHGQRFLDRIFTPSEQKYCLRYHDSGRHFAGRFAAKESIVKALGTGISAEVSWLDIEISNDVQGKPQVQFSSKVNAAFNDPHIHITISHCKSYATAVAIWTK